MGATVHASELFRDPMDLNNVGDNVAHGLSGLTLAKDEDSSQEGDLFTMSSILRE